MGLDHVMILNMEHDIERYWASLGALDTLGFDVTSNQIIRHNNHNGLHYKDTKSVHREAIEDGFPEFESFRSRGRRNAAWIWSYRRAMRKIVEMDKTVLVLIDDVVPAHHWTFDQFNMLLAEVEGRPLKIIQLPDPLERPDIPQSPKVTNMLYKGLWDISDLAVILNAAGASLVLRLYTEYPECHPNYIYGRLARSGENIDGLYHTFIPSCRFLLFDRGFPSQLHVHGAEDEPWEVE